jgi:hypothetical protein
MRERKKEKRRVPVVARPGRGGDRPDWCGRKGRKREGRLGWAAKKKRKRKKEKKKMGRAQRE